MYKRSKLHVAVYQLGYEPALNGTTSTIAIKSVRTKIATIEKLLIEYHIVILGKKLNGRQRPELLTSLEEDQLIPPTPNPPFVPSQPSTNTCYLQLKELISSLEDDAVLIVNGNPKTKEAYRRKAKACKKAIQSLRTAIGISNTSKTKTHFINPTDK